MSASWRQGEREGRGEEREGREEVTERRREGKRRGEERGEGKDYHTLSTCMLTQHIYYQECMNGGS